MAEFDRAGSDVGALQSSKSRRQMPKVSWWDIGSVHMDIGMEWLHEQTEANVFNAQVKVKVGPCIKAVSILCYLAVLAYIVYSFSQTPVWFQTEVPFGSFSYWAGNEDTMEEAGNQQLADASQCKYAEEYDFLYEENSKWDYRTNACQVEDVDKVALKNGGQSIQYTTYQHLRRGTKVPKATAGTNCDAECKTVYPNWPTEADYAAVGADITWLSAHANTPLYQATKIQFPDIGLVENVHMRKAMNTGGQCLCKSFENVFLLGAEKLTFNYQHEYSATEAELSGSSRMSGTDDPLSFFITEGDDGQVLQAWQKGKTLKFTLEQALNWTGTTLDSPAPETMDKNLLCTGNCSEAKERVRSRMSGATIDIEVKYFNEGVTMPNGKAYDQIKANPEWKPPYAVHVFRHNVMWVSSQSESQVERNGDTVTEKSTYRYGIQVRILKAAGIIARFDVFALVNAMVEFVVLLSLPAMFVEFLVFKIHPESKVLNAAKCKEISKPEMYRTLCHNAIMAENMWQQLDSNNNGVIEKEEIRSVLEKFFKEPLRQTLPDGGESDDLSKIADLLMYYYDKGAPEDVRILKRQASDSMTSDRKYNITKKDVVDAALSLGLGHQVKDFLWEGLVTKMADQEFDLNFTQRRIMSKSARRRLMKRSMENGNDQDDAEKGPLEADPEAAAI